MIVLLVSQCNKRALPETRRILDQFAERAGDRTWTCTITQEGLNTLRKMLRKTARRNTAVSCRRFRGTRRIELEWIVGNRKKFNSDGTVPTNTTGRNILRSASEDNWHTAEVIAVAAGVAGLFHDFGKANQLFQKKLTSNAKTAEPLRHEWLSLLLFVAFVDKRNDQDWLTHLRTIKTSDDPEILKRFYKHYGSEADSKRNPVRDLPPFAKLVGWLIVSHHRLPIYPNLQEGGAKLNRLTYEGNEWGANWNSPQSSSSDWKTSDWKAVFNFKHGTPVSSGTWCKKAQLIAKRALRLPQLSKTDWLENDNFTSHIARLSLILADHVYSAQDANSKYQDGSYQVFANTDRKTEKPKQRLDEHNLAVGCSAYLFASKLPLLRSELPGLDEPKVIRKRSTNPAYKWQDKAYDVAVSMSQSSQDNGFFGVNMASTGKGKTYANVRIMYGLNNADKEGCRFTIALGLRTLTLQTGNALRERLNLSDDQLAVMIGSQAVKDLNDFNLQRQVNNSPEEDQAPVFGSESSEDLLDDTHAIHYDGTLVDGVLRRWLKTPNHGKPNKALQLLSAPAVVATIDHLMPACESLRGGKHIGPMLRLLTSDLILDEPDDFSPQDLPALARLVNWCGLLGGRVIFSSATMPPALITGLFGAYRAGRAEFNRACGRVTELNAIPCGWFDEFGSQGDFATDVRDFTSKNKDFMDKRVALLERQHTDDKAIRKACLISVPSNAFTPDEVHDELAGLYISEAQKLHLQHSSNDPITGKQVSVGLIRMANIEPLVAVAQKMISGNIPEDTRIHLCVYHSQHPMIVRSEIEATLDAVLSRHDENAIWQQTSIRKALDSHPEKHHLFIVLGSPVTEVGRDHDYDWAIAEPSSMRSLIQLAGRIQRHRRKVPATHNMVILDTNVRGMAKHGAKNTERDLVFTRPGFEAFTSKNFQGKGPLLLSSDSLSSLLQESDYKYISSIPRIAVKVRSLEGNSLVDIEHMHTHFALTHNSKYQLRGTISADHWWNTEQRHTWHGEIQRLTRFRQSTPNELFTFYLEDELDDLTFIRFSDSEWDMRPQNEMVDVLSDESLDVSKQVSAWGVVDITSLYLKISDELERELGMVSKQFGQISMRKHSGGGKYKYHPWLGFSVGG
ncbi:MAG: type I-F CRISPR-associated helicase Cas3f [Pseudomonadota bacterium]|nr:type I-F CRISPR-associated helicase Cas3f [Pseudomonadota bacterium]